MTPRRVWGIAAVLLGLVCFGVVSGIAVSAFASHSTFSTPGPATTTLTAGRWTLFQVLDLQENTGASDPASARTIDADAVKVLGPDGKSIAVTCAYCESGGAQVVPVDLSLTMPIATFDAPTSGSYTITAKNTSATNATVAVANPISKLNELAPYLSMFGFAGAALITVGIVLVITGGRGGRGGRVGRSTPYPPAGPPVASTPPPGWYPNPYRPDAGQMWWDGKQWTSNWR